MEGFLFWLSKNYFTDVVSTLVVSTNTFVESTETAVESVVASVLVALPPQEANNVTTPIAKNTFFIVCFFFKSVYVWDYKYSKTIDIVNTRKKN